MIKRALGWMLYGTLFTALIGYDIHRHGRKALLNWAAAAACFGAILWLRSRLETRLSRLVYASLVEAVQAPPPNTPLVDYETGDRLAITGKRCGSACPTGGGSCRYRRSPRVRTR